MKATIAYRKSNLPLRTAATLPGKIGMATRQIQTDRQYIQGNRETGRQTVGQGSGSNLFMYQTGSNIPWLLLPGCTIQLPAGKVWFGRANPPNTDNRNHHFGGLYKIYVKFRSSENKLCAKHFRQSACSFVFPLWK